MRKLFVFSVLFTLVTIPLGLWSSSLQDPSQDPGYGQSDPSMQQEQPQFAEGELLSVDPQNQSISIKTSDGSEMQLSYTDATTVSGAADSVEALGGKSGSQVRVTFDAATNTASSIEVLQ